MDLFGVIDVQPCDCASESKTETNSVHRRRSLKTAAILCVAINPYEIKTDSIYLIHMSGSIVNDIPNKSTIFQRKTNICLNHLSSESNHLLHLFPFLRKS